MSHFPPFHPPICRKKNRFGEAPSSFGSAKKVVLKFGVRSRKSFGGYDGWNGLLSTEPRTQLTAEPDSEPDMPLLEGEQTDRSLLRRFRSGEEDAATRLYVRYARRLEALARAQSGAPFRNVVDLNRGY